MQIIRNVLLGMLLLTTPAAFASLGGEVRDWRFTVYLDDDPVGRHNFTLTESEALRNLRSEARFTFKLLMIRVYLYEHVAEETWRGDCLMSLKANTNDNGKKTSVLGQARLDRFDFELRKGAAVETLPACIMTFAYWNPLLLKQSRLLNPQTGRYEDVRIHARGRESIQVHGQPVAADRYHLDAGKLQIDLWYAGGNRWVALDSRLENGRTLRYRIE